MDWQQALAIRLIDDPAVSAIIGSGVDWNDREQGTSLPCCVLELISDDRPQNLSGFHGRRESRVQVNCLSTDRGTSADLREAAIAALVTAGEFSGLTFSRGMIENVAGDAERTNPGRIFRERFDLLVMHD